MTQQLIDSNSTSDVTPGSNPEADLSTLVISLLKGVIYNDGDAKLWSALLKLQSRLRDYVRVLGLELHIDEAEGYAFLRSVAEFEESPSPLPRLVARRPLTFQMSLLLVLLRKKLLELDTKSGDTRLIMSTEEIVELVRVFLPDGANEARIVDQVEASISKIADSGFLRPLKSQSANIVNYEVRRILKAFVDAQWLSSLDQLLDEYSVRLQKDLDNDN